MAQAQQNKGFPNVMHVSSLKGLSESEVVTRRAQGQGNVVPFRSSRSYLHIVRENVFTFINVILFCLGFALILLGQYSDAIVSVGVVFFNLMVGVVQEVRAKRVLDRIALLTRPRATVIREGRERLVDPSEIVVQDILLVRPGDQVVVDGPVVSDAQLEVDESLLTGESDSVSKQTGEMLYSGSFCISGSACYQAESVGIQSVASQLAAEARAFRRVLTPLQKQINIFIQVMLLIATFLEMLLVFSSLIEHIPLVQSVKMAVVVLGIVPKGLFLATSVTYALGALRILGKGALVQQANAVESLSNVDVLCLDKTGTLTTNTLSLAAIHPLSIEEPDLRRLLGDYVANLPEGTPTSAAIAQACSEGQPRHLREYVPFSSSRKWSALSLDDEAGPGVYILGAPEMLQPSLRPGADLERYANAATTQGLRVILFAFYPGLVPLHESNGEPCLPNDLIPLGIISLRDTLRPEAQATLNSFAQANIQLKIISGDHPQTVAALAGQAGMGTDLRTVSGVELTEMDATQFAEAAEETSIFGRVSPQQKAQLIRAMRSRGHYVAMIGDGVNDVLSLKQANLGIAMQSGSQASRSVADIVLLKDSFATLPQTFREGQRIRNGMHNILKLFLTRVLYVTILLLATMMVDGFPFLPKQNGLLTLVTEGVPTLALAAWAQPGPPSRHLLRSFLHFVIPAGVTLSLAALGVYLAEFISTGQLAATQSALTTFAVVCGLLLIPFVIPPNKAWAGGNALNGDWRPSLLALGLLVGYMLLLTIPPLHIFFELAPLNLLDYLLIGVVAIVWCLILRWIWQAHLLERFLQVAWE